MVKSEKVKEDKAGEGRQEGAGERRERGREAGRQRVGPTYNREYERAQNVPQ